MTDVAGKSADRTAISEGSIEAWAEAQRLRCKAGDHCWSNWQRNGSSVVSRSGGSMDWEHDLGDCSIHTRECLVCPARMRMLQRFGEEGPHPDHPDVVGLIVRKVIESLVFDL